MSIETYDFEDFDIIDDDEVKEWKPFEPGIYQFTVKEFEKGNYIPKKDGKIPPCKQAIYTLEFRNDEGNKSTCKYFLPLAENAKWKIIRFFKACGEKTGENGRLHISFNAVIDKTGWAKLSVSPDEKWNNIDEMILPKDAPKESPKKLPKKNEPEEIIPDDEETLPF